MAHGMSVSRTATSRRSCGPRMRSSGSPRAACAALTCGPTAGSKPSTGRTPMGHEYLELPLDQAAEGYWAMDERRAIKTLLRPYACGRAVPCQSERPVTAIGALSRARNAGTRVAPRPERAAPREPAGGPRCREQRWTAFYRSVYRVRRRTVSGSLPWNLVPGCAPPCTAGDRRRWPRRSDGSAARMTKPR
jgi:hypothetical protein